MSKAQQFNQKMFAVLASDLEDMQDIKACFDALMIQYGVTYRKPLHLKSCFVDKCDSKYKGDVEEMFIDEINTLAHAKVFELMDEACNNFLDYSKAYWVRQPLGLGRNVEAFLNQFSKQ